MFFHFSSYYHLFIYHYIFSGQILVEPELGESQLSASANSDLNLRVCSYCLQVTFITYILLYLFSYFSLLWFPGFKK
jgi:hypothetical protein